MNNDMLDVNCDVLSELAEDFPMEMGVLIEMLNDTCEDFCQES
jgi:hypothetical protein